MRPCKCMGRTRGTRRSRVRIGPGRRTFPRCAACSRDRGLARGPARSRAALLHVLARREAMSLKVVVRNAGAEAELVLLDVRVAVDLLAALRVEQQVGIVFRGPDDDV